MSKVFSSWHITKQLNSLPLVAGRSFPAPFIASVRTGREGVFHINPLKKLQGWIAEERAAGNPFAHGAVLGTAGEGGLPRTRMLGVSFSADGTPRFHTSLGSRKVQDISGNPRASLTFAFQQKLRSVSLEGWVEALSNEQLDADWLTLDLDFRRHYLVFGSYSGDRLGAPEELRERKAQLPAGAEACRPDSFVGYLFKKIERVAFYEVSVNDFAACELFECGPVTGNWCRSLRVP